MNKFTAIGWLKHSEEDIFSDGCQPETSCTTGGHESFTGATLDALIKQCADFAGQEDMKNVLLDSCEEIGRLDIQVYEGADGTPASEHKVQQWREGKERLWLATYSFQLLEVKPIVLSRNVADKHIYAEG